MRSIQCFNNQHGAEIFFVRDDEKHIISVDKFVNGELLSQCKMTDEEADEFAITLTTTGWFAV